MADPKPQPKPNQKRIAIDMPKDLNAVYGNFAMISHTPLEIVMDIAQLLPRTNRGKVVTRVVMTPAHAKMLANALTKNIANYEKQFGEINLPKQPNIADDFFRFGQDGDEDGKEEK